MMQSRRFFELAIIILILIFLVESLSCQSTLKDEEYINSNNFNTISLLQKPNKQMTGLVNIGIKDQNENKLIWAVSQQRVSVLGKMLENYPYETDMGINYYKVPSWKFTNTLMPLLQQDQNNTVNMLYDEISLLKSRVKKLEKQISKLSKKK
jgi:hypothetical protein